MSAAELLRNADAEAPAPISSRKAETAPIVRFAGVRKSYKTAVALAEIDIAIKAGEFFTFLGPSGSGKTTTLRLLAGFERPDAGRIELDGRDVTRLPPFERDINTVFQDYALFPHMNVAANIAYGLETKRVETVECQRRVAEALRMVRLESFGERMPSQLSGGQRQRVALARAIVNRPRVLLLDEPLGALDLKLRQEMQLELKRIQTEVGITFIYVTHDQEEALTMSDRIAVFDRGRIVQTGTPREIYEAPADEFVAGFVGTCNLIVRDGVRLAIRPEKIRLLDNGETVGPGYTTEAGRLLGSVYVGMFTRHRVALDEGGEVTLVELNRGNAGPSGLTGAKVRIAWRKQHAFGLEASKGEGR